MKNLFTVLYFTLLEDLLISLLETINILIRNFYNNYNYTFKIL